MVAGFCKEFVVKQARGQACCPWIQGQGKRLNQTLKNKLSANLRSHCLEIFFGENIKESFSLDKVQELVDNVPNEAVGVDLTIYQGEPAMLLGDLDDNEDGAEDDEALDEPAALT